MIKGCTRHGGTWQKWEVIDKEGESKHIEIEISDTGHGIDSEDINDIFEPFYTTKGQKGTGLGLAIIWGIIDNHGGTIRVDSEIDKGTTFTVRLPVEEARLIIPDSKRT